jgi:hypothetical protein
VTKELPNEIRDQDPRLADDVWTSNTAVVVVVGGVQVDLEDVVKRR